MRLCRYGSESQPKIGFYTERHIFPFWNARAECCMATGALLPVTHSDDLLDFLPPDGRLYAVAKQVAEWLDGLPELPQGLALDATARQLLVPIPRPNKVFLLAGNYAEHIREGGGIATERAETFPYVFM